MLSNMQQKLDSLCAQISNIKDHSGTVTPVMSPMKNIELQSNEEFGCAKIKFVDCGCWLCDQHRDLSDGLVVRIISYKLNWFVWLINVLSSPMYHSFASSLKILNVLASLHFVTG